MKRAFLALVLTAGAVLGQARADYILIRVNLNNLSLDTFTPPDPNQPKPMTMATGQPAPEPAIPVWAYAHLELKAKAKPQQTMFGNFVQVDHAWGKTTMIPYHPDLNLAPLVRDPLNKEFDKLMKKELRSGRDPERLLALAAWALEHDLMKEFHSTMADLGKLDPKRPALIRYGKIQAEIKKALPSDDPANAALLLELQKENYTRRLVSDQGHYALLTNLPASPQYDGLLHKRLARLESMYESYFYWWALQEYLPLPAMPTQRLLALHINDPQAFTKKAAYWDASLIYGCGFTPHRDNIMVLGTKRQDHAFTLLEKNNRSYWANLTLSREECLSGLIWQRQDLKLQPFQLALVQTLAVVERAMEEECERLTLSHEPTRQLLVATGLLPRNVAVPEWIRFGLSSFFETSYGALQPGVGLASTSHLINFKYYRAAKKLPASQDLLFQTVTDRLFRRARLTGEEKGETAKDREKIADKVRQELEVARAASWALVYYLARAKKLELLLNYCRELDKLPRDLDLDEGLLQSCFAKGFGLAGKDGRVNPAAFQGFADAWFAEMELLSLDQADLESELFTFRTKMYQPVAPMPAN